MIAAALISDNLMQGVGVVCIVAGLLLTGDRRLVGPFIALIAEVGGV